MFIDSHAHLTAEAFAHDRDEVIRRALDAGVEYIVNPGTDLEDSRAAVELADKYASVYACVGFHPHDANKADEKSLLEIEELCKHPRVVGIGEIGLDFYYNFSPRDRQEAVFNEQIGLARRQHLPIVIHTREAIEPTLRIVEEAVAQHGGSWRAPAVATHSRQNSPLGVFHCFPGDVATAWKVIGMGFFVSVPGIVTFKKSGFATAVAEEISPEHLLLETDSPYLAPVPHRGKRNEPANLPLIAERIAQLQHLSAEDIGRATNYNILRLFGIGSVAAPQITYKLKNALYINLTIRCNADCVFCDRKGDAVIKGNNLRIEREPTVEEVIAEIGDPTRYDEIVFCGYGEPTIRLEDLKRVARWVKEQGGMTRLNTDGHGNIINKRHIVPELVGLIDAVSISLNSADPAQYGRLMQIDASVFFPAMLEFAREAVKEIPRVVMTIVDLKEVDKERAKRLVEELGAEFYERPYF
jgi:TatD DNase family protein